MSKPQIQILGPDGRPLRSAAAYTGAGAGFGGQMKEWTPALKTADAALLPNLRLATARADDLGKNNALASGGLRAHVENVVGHLFRLNYKPRWKRLGIEEEDARSFIKDVEAIWAEIAEDPANWIDAERSRTFTMMCREAVNTHIATGDVMAHVEWIEDRPGSLLKTAIKMVSPKRVCNPNLAPDTDTQRGGVKLDRHGAALGYHVRSTSSLSGTGLGYSWEFLPREKAWGRPEFLHIFEPLEDGQTRGANRFLAVMEQLHMMPKMQSTKLQNAIINAMFAATIESELDTEAAFEMIAGEGGDKKLLNYMSMINEFHQASPIHLNGSRISHLLPGEKLNLKTPGSADNGYSDFETSIMRWIAAGSDLSFETVSRDFSRTNYSSARASMLLEWRFAMGRRKVIIERFASLVFRVVLEELVQRKLVKLPRSRFGFYEAMNAWCNCTWTGTGRMAIDGLKEVKEALLKIEGGLSTYEKELSQMGEDYTEIFEQQVREMRERTAAGLPPPSWMESYLSNQPDEGGAPNGGN
ncbi:phage portal protein [Pokkaliibacter sp. CJK22405]|uniref:phage portal protein n=1 Tax=Pokkaliibacter sp. CJK22405 TaxID=3384615 RepID=UPI003985423F